MLLEKLSNGKLSFVRGERGKPRKNISNNFLFTLLRSTSDLNAKGRTLATFSFVFDYFSKFPSEVLKCVRDKWMPGENRSFLFSKETNFTQEGNFEVSSVFLKDFKKVSCAIL